MGQTTFSGPVKSDNGFTSNSFTTTQRNALTPAQGLLIFNITTDVYEVYDGSAWVEAFAPAVAPVTYTAGVDYTLGVPLRFNSGSLSITGTPWSNTTGYYTMLASPSGTIYTATASSSSGTITTTGPWSGGGGFDFVSGDGTGVFAAGGPYDITSITFIPTTLPYLGGRSPGFGPEAGGTTVTLSGINFTGATSVTFDGVAAASFSVVNATTITAVTPPGTGTVPIVVTTPLGASNSKNFSYEP